MDIELTPPQCGIYSFLWPTFQAHFLVKNAEIALLIYSLLKDWYLATNVDIYHTVATALLECERKLLIPFPAL